MGFDRYFFIDWDERLLFYSVSPGQWCGKLVCCFLLLYPGKSGRGPDDSLAFRSRFDWIGQGRKGHTIHQPDLVFLIPFACFLHLRGDYPYKQMDRWTIQWIEMDILLGFEPVGGSCSVQSL